jgi:hypothetical protein
MPQTQLKRGSPELPLDEISHGFLQARDITLIT